MKVIAKFMPYFYFAIAGLLLVNSIGIYSEDQESYRVLFSYETESSTTFLAIRIVMILLIVLAGFSRLKRLKQV